MVEHRLTKSNKNHSLPATNSPPEYFDKSGNCCYSWFSGRVVLCVFSWVDLHLGLVTKLWWVFCWLSFKAHSFINMVTTSSPDKTNNDFIQLLYCGGCNLNCPPQYNSTGNTPGEVKVLRAFGRLDDDKRIHVALVVGVLIFLSTLPWTRLCNR